MIKNFYAVVAFNVFYDRIAGVYDNKHFMKGRINMESIKERLKEIRKVLNISQREFGEKIGVKVAAVGNWEIGRQAIPDARIYQICNEFNVRSEWLENGEGEMFKPIKSETDVIREAALVLFKRLDKKAQAAVLEGLREFNAGKGPVFQAANSTQIYGGKNQVNIGTNSDDIYQK